MDHTYQYSKTIPVADHFDVVICGGGPAGIGAAVAAAENGARTALIERFGFLGGMATAGYVTRMSEFAFDGRRVIGGIPWRFVQELEAAGGAQVEKPRYNVSFDPEKYKLVAWRAETPVRTHEESVIFFNCRGLSRTFTQKRDFVPIFKTVNEAAIS